jgi:hypothetical protein
MMAAKQAVKAARKTLDKAFKGEVDENFISMAPQAVAEEWSSDAMDSFARDAGSGPGRGTVRYHKKSNTWAATDGEGSIKIFNNEKSAKRWAAKNPVDEGLDANQKRVGQLGPTEKVKNNNIGKLVGANESTEIAPELARIIEMARFKR